jgi:hypothetical protein
MSSIDRSLAVIRWIETQKPRYTRGFEKRQHPDLNWGMEVLQTSALPLGYAAAAYYYIKIVE